MPRRGPRTVRMLRVSRGGWSLRVRLVALVALAVLPVRLAGLTFISHEANAVLRQKVDRELELRTHNLASTVRAWDEYMVLALDNLRGLPDIVSMDPSRQRPVLAHMAKVYSKLIVLGTVDAAGTNIARSDSRPPMDYRQRDWFAGATSGNPINRQTVLSLTTGSPSVAYAAPVRDAAGKVVGAVFCTMDQRDILRQVGAGRFGRTGYSFVVDERAQAVAYPNTDAKSPPSLGDFPPVKAMATNASPTAGVFTDGEGQRWRYHAVRLENGWGVVGVQREDEALAQAGLFRVVGWGIIGGSTLLALAVIWVIAGRTLLPIRRLTIAVQGLADGNWGQSVPAGAPGELGGLVTAFNTMSRQLHAAYRGFEQRVAERTAELERAERKARRAWRRMAQQASHDSLTGLPNRTLFRERLQQAIERTRREPNFQFAVLFLDLNRFKLVNDSLGHVVGDKLLVAAAQRLRRCLRAADTVTKGLAGAATIARLGGDEFTVLLRGLRAPADARGVAERLGQEMAQPFNVDGHEVFASASIGIAVGQGINCTADDLMRSADAAMYRAKVLGDGRCVVFDDTLHAEALARLQLERDLRHALERNELLLHYQPIVDLTARRLTGFEALARWNREGKPMSPAQFIPVAEDTGLIVPIGGWVLEEACRQLACWQQADARLRQVNMSVNLSRRQLADADLVARVHEALRRNGIEPHRLKLEITESVIMDNSDAGRQVLLKLKGLGVGLYMDDFGTGYSSLSCLHRLPLDGLKIDQSFVRGASGRRDSIAVLHAIVSLARNLGMTVIAEGVELAEQVALLKALDCDYVQGSYFSPPLAPESAARFAVPEPALPLSA